MDNHNIIVIGQHCPPSQRCKPAVGNICFAALQPIGLCSLMCLITRCSRLDVRYGQTWHPWHDCTAERRLVVSFCGQPHSCNRPYYPAARYRTSSVHMVSAQSFPDRLTCHGPCLANLCGWGLADSAQSLNADNEPSSCHVSPWPIMCSVGCQTLLNCSQLPVNKIWKQIAISAQCWQWCP